ncbi:unnamed protein product [Ceutorhynchus assimilis]|uniref:Major facilitator superfamily (MFS) profile domain-containing protein n=1 Tax=Ceutorhynchus assimilis TaxID=467358 RepID=A0A9N9MVY1_9CUCU|nr:unnamed protein product [Ceutorhynchus assimilis]CAG9771607.1 unnamed protein product [Ceutorhynchus assimilis]
MATLSTNPEPDNTDTTLCCHPLAGKCCYVRLPQRIILAILLHFLLQSNFSNRIVLNIAIVEMVEPAKNDPDHQPACPEFEQPNHTQEGSFSWSQTTKSLILYAFYIGYTPTQIPGGWLADKYGARYVLIVSVLITITSSATLPVTVHHFGYIAAVVNRLVLGASHGVCIPCTASLVSTWIPPEERATLGSLCYSGMNLGVVAGSLITGVLMEFFNSWSPVFYLWGGYSGIYLIFLCLYLFSFPDDHPFMSQVENEYIRSASGLINLSRQPKNTPWKAILTNAPYWANVWAQFAHHFIYFTIITYLPTYMSDILMYGVAHDGLFAAMPFAAMYLFSLVLSFTTSKVFLRCMTKKTFDKYFGAGSNVVSSALLLAATFSECNRYLVNFFFIASMIVKAFYYVTLPININTLSRNYGGLLYGGMNAISSISGVIGNLIMGYLAAEKQFFGWKIAFSIMLALSVVTTVAFFIFSSDERQEFDYLEDEIRDK